MLERCSVLSAIHPVCEQYFQQLGTVGCLGRLLSEGEFFSLLIVFYTKILTLILVYHNTDISGLVLFIQVTLVKQENCENPKPEVGCD